MTASAQEERPGRGFPPFILIDLERDADRLERLFEEGAGRAPRVSVILTSATMRSMPLALKAAHAGFVIGVLPTGAPERDLQEVASRGQPTRLAAFRDISRLVARQTEMAETRPDETSLA